MDRQVKGYRDPGDGRLPAKLGIAEQDRGAVVVAVEECCWGHDLGRAGWIGLMPEAGTYSWVSF